MTLQKVKLRDVEPATHLMPIQRQSASRFLWKVLRSQSHVTQGEKLTLEESKCLMRDDYCYFFILNSIIFPAPRCNETVLLLREPQVDQGIEEPKESA